ncbi:MAG: hypothetical protein OXG36_19205 [Caldilineaceae bacterium]|nr:hypothetical protein [Caldilineaceae bacterium]
MRAAEPPFARPRCSTPDGRAHADQRALGQLQSVLQPGWFQAQRLLHHAQAWARCRLHPLPGPNPPGKLQQVGLDAHEVPSTVG